MEAQIGLHKETVSESPRVTRPGLLDDIIGRAATLAWLVYAKITRQEFFLG